MGQKQAGVEDRGVKLVAEYRAGDESRKAFCERHGIALSTLDYYVRRESRREARSRLLRVEIQAPAEAGKPATAGVALALSSGLRVELESGFDESVLLRVLALLERK